MAFTLNQLRNQMLTSILGRRLGLDTNEFLVGAKGVRPPITDATSDTTATAIPNHGLVSVVTTTDDGWTLSAPVPGCQVTLFTNSTSTGTHTVTLTNATAITTAGTAGSTITMVAMGASITLAGISTSVWMQLARGSTAAGYCSS